MTGPWSARNVWQPLLAEGPLHVQAALSCGQRCVTGVLSDSAPHILLVRPVRFCDFDIASISAECALLVLRRLLPRECTHFFATQCAPSKFCIGRQYANLIPPGYGTYLLCNLHKTDLFREEHLVTGITWLWCLLCSLHSESHDCGISLFYGLHQGIFIS